MTEQELKTIEEFVKKIEAIEPKDEKEAAAKAALLRKIREKVGTK